MIQPVDGAGSNDAAALRRAMTGKLMADGWIADPAAEAAFRTVAGWGGATNSFGTGGFREKKNHVTEAMEAA